MSKAAIQKWLFALAAFAVPGVGLVSAAEPEHGITQQAVEVARPFGFLSQPFSVAQVFAGRDGKQVPVAETVRGFKEILEGKRDSVAKGDFYMKGGIDEVKPS
jgi:F0F1-type ATP synthase beta subunit